MPVKEQSLTYLVQFYESTLAELMARDLEAKGETNPMTQVTRPETNQMNLMTKRS